MLTTFHLNYKNFTIAAAITFVVAIALLACSFSIGKTELFLLLNNDMGKAGDFFFNYFTHIGDGLLWVFWLLAIINTRRRHLLPLVLAAFAFTTIFVQVCKQVIYPEELRPTEAIADKALIHTVEGVTVHSINSFPSGHTATAFTFALLIAVLVRSRGLMFLCVGAAVVVGYTRIYLAQHFPLDVAAGMLVAVLSVSFALWIQSLVKKRKKRKIGSGSSAV